MVMKNATQSDATLQRGLFKIWISCALAGLIGAIIATILIFSLLPRYVFPLESSCHIASHIISSIGVSSANVDPVWHITIRNMVDGAAQQAEVRLRDHFTLLLAMAGVGTAIILAMFSLSQARREEQALSEMKELRTEAKDILTEIRQCGETAHTTMDKIKEGFKTLKDSPTTESEEKQGGTSCYNQLGAEEQKPEEDGSIEEGTAFSPAPPPVCGLEQPPPPAETPEESLQASQIDLEQRQTLTTQGNTEVPPKWDANIAELISGTHSILSDTKQRQARKHYSVGKLYDRGDFDRNQQIAALWYLKAAEQGYAPAALEMASRYFNGKGVPENYIEAYVFLLLYKASEDGDQNETVQSLHESLAKLLKPEQLAAAQQKAAGLWHKIHACED